MCTCPVPAGSDQGPVHPAEGGRTEAQHAEFCRRLGVSGPTEEHGHRCWQSCSDRDGERGEFMIWCEILSIFVRILLKESQVDRSRDACLSVQKIVRGWGEGRSRA